MNPGPPAPQASVIIRTSRKNPVTPVCVIQGYSVILDYGPAYEDYNNRIIKTLQQMVADGRKRATIRSAVWTLRTLNRRVDLMNPEAVKLATANLKNKTVEPASDAKKHKLI